MPRPSVREKLVAAALERFQDQGFNGCGVQDITDAAGVPKGSFYNHFKSKEALAIEALDRYSQATRVDLLMTPDVKALTRLRAHFEFLAERLFGWGFNRGCLLGNFSTETSDTNPQIREAMAAAFDRWTEAVATVLSDAQAEGELDPKLEAVPLARFLVNGWEGAVARAKVTKSREPIDDYLGISFGRLLVKAAKGEGF